MDFHKTATAFGATACLLMGVTAFATATPIPASDTFEGGHGNWNGDVAELAESVTPPTPAGLPISGSAVQNNTVLSVSGSATNTYTGADSNPFVDMMVKVSVPDEALSDLATGSGGDAEGAKFAVAVDKVANDTTGQFKYWNGNAWALLSSTAYAADSWVRVTMKFDYTAGKCTVAINGDPCGTYALIASASALASVEVRGSTAIDEVKVAQGILPAFADTTAKQGDTVTKAWLTANDIPWETNLTTAVADGSGYSLTQKYKFGLEPADGKKFALEFAQSTHSNGILLQFPGNGAYGGAGSYVLQTLNGSTWEAVNPQPGYTRENGVTEFLVGLPGTAGTAVQYRIFPVEGALTGMQLSQQGGGE